VTGKLKNVSVGCRVHVGKDMRELIIDLWKKVISSPYEVDISRLRT
jgi:hypothetical protein